MVEREQIVRPVKVPLAGNWLQRAGRAILKEHRLPYQAQASIDAVCSAVGWRRKMISAGEFRLCVRRRTCDEQFAQTVILEREYNPPGFEIGPTDTVIDIGGNIGTFALLASRWAARGRVITYEPDAENFDLLSRNLRMNRAANVTAVNAAVGGRNGSATLFKASQGGFHTILEEQARTGSQHHVVRLITLKELFETHAVEQCDFMKLDCEGAEYEILFSAPPDYLARIRKLAMEYHGPTLAEARTRSAALANYLQQMGFDVTYQEYDGLGCGYIRAQRAVAG